MKAEILSIGTELLMGEIVDTNSSYLSAQLPPLGIDLYWISTVGDNAERLGEVLARAWSRSHLIITTGGLGPTKDDLTRESIAQLLREEMVVDAALEERLRAGFTRRGLTMPSSNLKQASLIPSTQSLPNPRGTAPGWWVEKEGRIIVALPGPPPEMRGMWQEEVLPRLQQRSTGEMLFSRTLKTAGLMEATLDEMLTPWLSAANPTVAIYAKEDGVHVRLAAKARSQEEAQAAITPLEEKIRSLIEDYIWGVDDDSLEKRIGALLLERGLTLATMESCTGGLLADTITNVPGSSNFFRGGLVSYTNQTKMALGIEPELLSRYGAVSPEVAEAMAATCRQRLGADIGVSTTGVAGPDLLEGKPVGTVHIGVVDGHKKHITSHRFQPNRLSVKRRGALTALVQLRRFLLSQL
ncbi:MAG: competence/damage-inducible protein A [Chloroflexi bacterium]|nr:competence/damage-inducible protein A [Chloroflexota bacterium]